MSQENQDIIEQSQEKLSQKELQDLINRTLKEGNFEAQFILVLSEWKRPGSDFVDEGKIEILYGEIEKILMNHKYDYPTTNEYTYAIIPKTRTVVLLFKQHDDYEGKLKEHEILYVFDYSHGWRSISLY